jgi:hypothetical protein
MTCICFCLVALRYVELDCLVWLCDKLWLLACKCCSAPAPTCRLTTPPAGKQVCTAPRMLCISVKQAAPSSGGPYQFCDGCQWAPHFTLLRHFHAALTKRYLLHVHAPCRLPGQVKKRPAGAAAVKSAGGHPPPPTKRPAGLTIK